MNSTDVYNGQQHVFITAVLCHVEHTQWHKNGDMSAAIMVI